MKCPKCGSDNTSHYEEWDEYWDGENETIYLNCWWDCHDCHHRVLAYDTEYEYPEDAE